MKKQLMSILFTIILIFSIKSTCNAASANISCASSATVGEQITISANVTGVMWNLELKVNGETIAKNNELENYASNKTITFSGKYTPKEEGKLNVTLIGTVTEFSNGSTIRDFQSKTIVVKAKEITPPSTSEPEKPSVTPTPEPEKKSSNASLTNLGIKPNDFKGFKSNKTEYSVEVPNSVESVNVYATPVKGATVKGDGDVELKEGDNTVKVTVTAEDGKTTKTYTLKIKRKTAAEEAENAGEARLKNLGIKPEEFDFTGFDSEKTEYSIEVPNEVKEIEVYATAMNSKAQITGTGMIELQEGKNELKIDVIAEDGAKKTYTLQVTRKESDEIKGNVESFGLSTLVIKGITLNPSFNVGTYEYKLGLNEDLSSLDIQTKANEENSTVEIIGNENLQQGENIITILVTNKDTGKVITYQIMVNKNIVTEEIVQTSWLKPSTWGKEEKIKIAIIIILIILIISVIILKINMAKEDSKNKEREFPGADELDRAIAEHQELSTHEEILEEKNDELTYTSEIVKSESEANYIQEIAASRSDYIDEYEELENRPRRRRRNF